MPSLTTTLTERDRIVILPQGCAPVVLEWRRVSGRKIQVWVIAGSDTIIRKEGK